MIYYLPRPHYAMRKSISSKEAMMTSHPAASVAFRHVIEDGLSILSSKNLDPSRCGYVLAGLRDLINEATKGFELVRQHSLVVSSDDRNAYESFSFIERHLSHHYNEQLIQASKTAFDQLAKNATPSKKSHDAAVTLLQQLLSSISREGNSGIPSEPEQIKLAG